MQDVKPANEDEPRLQFTDSLLVLLVLLHCLFLLLLLLLLLLLFLLLIFLTVLLVSILLLFLLFFLCLCLAPETATVKPMDSDRVHCRRKHAGDRTNITALSEVRMVVDTRHSLPSYSERHKALMASASSSLLLAYIPDTIH